MPESRTDRFDALVAPHLGTLLRVAYRLVRNTSDAQDLVQETCIAACENPAGIGAADHPVRWLLHVLHNRFVDRHRRQSRSSLVGLEEADAATPLVCERPLAVVLPRVSATTLPDRSRKFQVLDSAASAIDHPAINQMVLDNLAGAEALFWIQIAERVVRRPGSDPRLRAALEKIAAEGANPELRKAAERVLQLQAPSAVETAAPLPD